jgi:hypothetical protein
VSPILGEQFAEALPDVKEYRPAIKSTGKPALEPVQADARVRILSGQATVKGGYWLGSRRQFAIEAHTFIRTGSSPLMVLPLSRSRLKMDRCRLR